MSKEVPFDFDAVCDECGCTGAYDFYGDYFCSECFNRMVDRESSDTLSNEVADGPRSGT